MSREAARISDCSRPGRHCVFILPAARAMFCSRCSSVVDGSGDGAGSCLEAGATAPGVYFAEPTGHRHSWPHPSSQSISKPPCFFSLRIPLVLPAASRGVPRRVPSQRPGAGTGPIPMRAHRQLGARAERRARLGPQMGSHMAATAKHAGSRSGGVWSGLDRSLEG